MARNVTRSRQIICSACHREGTVKLEEAESPPHRGAALDSYDDDIVEMIGPFRIEGKGTAIIIRCECGQQVQY